LQVRNASLGFKPLSDRNLDYTHNLDMLLLIFVVKMNTAHIIRDMIKYLNSGDQQRREGNYEGSVNCYNKALKLARALPSEAKFDRRSFEVLCQSGLSASYGRLNKHQESLSAATMALLFYDECGENYPAQTGRWLMAIVNQGTALASLGIFETALAAFQRAKDMFTHKGIDTQENRQWLNTVDENIVLIKAHLEKQEQ
jgi:tetratricopeptide (TPR) repeat protein